jgi:hypothetical protein
MAEKAELAGALLIQLLDEDLAIGQDADARRGERSTGGCAVLDQEVRDAAAVHGKSAAALDADAGAAEGLAHLGERARPVLELDGQIPHSVPPVQWCAAVSTATGSS